MCNGHPNFPNTPPKFPEENIKVRDKEPTYPTPERIMINVFSEVNTALIKLEPEYRERVIKAIAILNDMEM